MPKKKAKKVTPDQLKLDLFSLDPLLDKNYSNSLEIYDLAGKYVYDKHRKYLSTASAEETEISRVTSYNGADLNISVTAANIVRNHNGKKQRVFVFPGAREDVLEEILRKLATERRAEPYEVTTGDNAGLFVGIRFSLYEVFQELRRVGKAYSYAEIREALDIMSHSILTIKSMDDSISFSAPFFPVMTQAEHEGETHTFVCFHPLVTDVILSQKYRRYNYAKALEFRKHYTRLTYKRLCLRWIQASPGKPYTILLSTLISAMKTPAANLAQDKKLFKEVMEELVAADVLERFSMTPKKDGKKVTDWLLTLYASNSFAKQMAANNKVAKHTSGKGLPNPESDEHQALQDSKIEF